MSNINSAVISGNLTRDPEIKMVGAEGDFAIVNLGVAVNRSKKNDEGGYDDETSYFDVTVFGKFGELIDRKLRKGDSLTVSGRLEQQRWETEDGQKRSKVVLIASDIDSPALYKTADQIGAKEDGEATASTESSSAAPKDDDIPF